MINLHLIPYKILWNLYGFLEGRHLEEVKHTAKAYSRLCFSGPPGDTGASDIRSRNLGFLFSATLMQLWTDETKANRERSRERSCNDLRSQRSWPLWGEAGLDGPFHRDHLRASAYQVFKFQFKMVAKLQLWNSNEILLWLGVTTSWRTVFKGLQHEEG